MRLADKKCAGDIIGLAKSAGLAVRPRTGNKTLWDETLNKLPYQPVSYTNASLDYQLVYQRGHGGDWEDISLVIFWDNKPVALWPLSFSIKDGQAALTSQGIPVLPPIFVAECPAISCKRIVKACLDIANIISSDANLNSWKSGESFVNVQGMSDWHVESMVRDATGGLCHDLYLDLHQNMAEIKTNFRKSYKSLVEAGSKMWVVGILESKDEGVWQEFRELHLVASGRVTRSDETWDMQHQDVNNKHAFLVWLRNGRGQMVGGGLFSFTRDEGVYAVGAYDRALFDKPLGHVVQYRAITELKNRDVHWYKLGTRFFRTDMPIPTDKEISISEFKQGFASHFFPQYRLTHKVVGDEST